MIWTNVYSQKSYFCPYSKTLWKIIFCSEKNLLLIQSNSVWASEAKTLKKKKLCVSESLLEVHFAYELCCISSILKNEAKPARESTQSHRQCHPGDQRSRQSLRFATRSSLACSSAHGRVRLPAYLEIEAEMHWADSAEIIDKSNQLLQLTKSLPCQCNDLIIECYDLHLYMNATFFDSIIDRVQIR